MQVQTDLRNVPNFANTLVIFRGLRHDPNNQYLMPFTWGTTVLVARTNTNEEIREDPLTFPPPEVLQNAEVLLPLSAEGSEQYNNIWSRFKEALQQ